MLQLIFLLEGVIVYDDYFTMIKCKYKSRFFQIRKVQLKST